METKFNLGDVSVTERLIQRSGGNAHTTFNFELREVSLNLEQTSTSQILRECGDVDRNKLAGEVSNYLAVEPLTALYLMGPESGYPVKIGITDDPRLRMSTLQSGSYEKMIAHAIFWTYLGGSFEIEQRVLKYAKKNGLHERGEWLSVTPITAVELVVEAAQEAGVRLFTSAMAIENRGRMMLLLDKAIVDDRRERAA